MSDDHNCMRCEDAPVDRAALGAAVRHVRRELNATLDEIEERILQPPAIDVQLREPAR